MELARLIRSRVKGHHVFKSESRPGDTFTCAREPGNPHSPDAIIVKLSDGSNVGHVPDPRARVLAPMLDGGEIERKMLLNYQLYGMLSIVSRLLPRVSLAHETRYICKAASPQIFTKLGHTVNSGA